MQEHEQQLVDSRIFSQEVSQCFTIPLQQTSIIYTSQPTSIVQQQNDGTIQIPIIDKSVTTTCETTDVAFVGYIMQPQPSQNQHQILEIQNISMENFTQHPQTSVSPTDYLSVVMLEPKIKDAATNTEEKRDVKKLPIKKQASKPEIQDQTPTESLEQRFYCQFCVRDFSSLPALMHHHKCSHQKLPDDPNSSQKFVSPTQSLEQRCEEKVPEPLVCQVCNIYFSNHDIFIKHQESHGISRRKFTCSFFCGQEFSDVNAYKKHLRMHETQYVCDVCNKSFYSNAILTTHKKVHSAGLRPYQCDLCSKRFFTKSHAQNHRRVHSGERPFSCSYCGRAFAESSSHRRHERLHQQNKKYQCEVCKRGFALSVSLSKHLAKQHSYT